MIRHAPGPCPANEHSSGQLVNRVLRWLLGGSSSRHRSPQHTAGHPPRFRLRWGVLACHAEASHHLLPVARRSPGDGARAFAIQIAPTGPRRRHVAGRRSRRQAGGARRDDHHRQRQNHSQDRLQYPVRSHIAAGRAPSDWPPCSNLASLQQGQARCRATPLLGTSGRDRAHHRRRLVRAHKRGSTRGHAPRPLTCRRRTGDYRGTPHECRPP